MLEYFDIEKDPKELLKFKDVRSVKKWCAKKGILVFRQGKGWCVSKAEFLLAFHRPIVEKLRANYENWDEVFQAYLANDMKAIAAFIYPKTYSQKVSRGHLPEKANDFINKIMSNE